MPLLPSAINIQLDGSGTDVTLAKSKRELALTAVKFGIKLPEAPRTLLSPAHVMVFP